MLQLLLLLLLLHADIYRLVLDKRGFGGKDRRRSPRLDCGLHELLQEHRTIIHVPTATIKYRVNEPTTSGRANHKPRHKNYSKQVAFFNAVYVPLTEGSGGKNGALCTRCQWNTGDHHIILVAEVAHGITSSQKDTKYEGVRIFYIRKIVVAELLIWGKRHKALLTRVSHTEKKKIPMTPTRVVGRH